MGPFSIVVKVLEICALIATIVITKKKWMIYGYNIFTYINVHCTIDNNFPSSCNLCKSEHPPMNSFLMNIIGMVS